MTDVLLKPRPGGAVMEPETAPRRETTDHPGREPAAAPSRSGKRAGWLRRYALSLGVLACLLALATYLIGTGITHYPSFADDEGTYVAEAWAVITHGQLSHYTYWYDHPPLGWIGDDVPPGQLAGPSDETVELPAVAASAHEI